MTSDPSLPAAGPLPASSEPPARRPLPARFIGWLLLSDSARYRWAVASRAVAAIGGGYVVAALAATMLALYLPTSRVEATMTGTLASFLAYACAVIWVFAVRSAWKAWGGLLLVAAVLGVMVWAQLPSGGAA
jgi:hypothetical protein